MLQGLQCYALRNSVLRMIYDAGKARAFQVLQTVTARAGFDESSSRINAADIKNRPLNLILRGAA